MGSKKSQEAATIYMCKGHKTSETISDSAVYRSGTVGLQMLTLPGSLSVCITLVSEAFPFTEFEWSETLISHNLTHVYVSCVIFTPSPK